jgi:hypothetical protein
MTKIKFLSVVGLLAACVVCSYGQTKPAAGKSSPEVEKLREKLTQYVAEGKEFERSKVCDFNNPVEFGQFLGESNKGHFYRGNNYSLIISFEIDDRLKIIDFILDEKGKLYPSDHSYSDCAVFKNRKPFTVSELCDEISVVKLKTANPECMVDVPVVKAWKRGKDGKYVEVDATGLSWYEDCP